jgi:hypothetical protein
MHKIGWHLKNVDPVRGEDWGIISRVPPAAITFISGERVTPQDIGRILEISPQCHVIMRPSFKPGLIATREELLLFIRGAKAHMDDFRDFIPEGQRHLQIFNEQNMPRQDPQWQGFGTTLEDMKHFNEWFCIAYDELKAHDPSWKIGWTPLTIGNMDVWMEGDPLDVPYYMHGPEASHPGASDEEVKAAILSGPCYESLMKADEYYAHIYLVTDARKRMYEEAYGMRWKLYEKFFPKPMDIFFTENGLDVDPDSYPEWYDLLRRYPQVKGTCLWILGEGNFFL